MANNYHFLTAEQKAYILQEYPKCEKTYKEIGDEIGLGEGSVRDFIRNKVRKGELVRIDRSKFVRDKVVEYHRSKNISGEKYDVSKHKANPNVDVNCNKSFRTCIFGCRGNSGRCNFQACTNRSRYLSSPDPKHCHDYVRIDKDHPKLTGKDFE